VLHPLSTTLFRYAMLFALAACASSGSGASATRGSPDRLTRAEITASSATNAYELISRLRPQWLRAPATGSIGAGVRMQAILVYLNRERLEDVNALKTISTDGIDSAEWIDATRAPTILSDVPTTAIAGAIVIRTR
jgi:Flp pilus assembly protein TadD